MKHGMVGTRIYNIWKDMKKRCYCKTRKDYARYGGRGITVCDEWLHNFQAFYSWAMANGYKDDLTIDRIDVNGNYEPSNCRWITKYQQASNTRRNHLITYKGKTQTLTQWAREYDIPDTTLYGRLSKRHMTMEQALTTPIAHQHNITFDGKTKTLNQWAKQTGISYSTLHKRIFELHWSIEKAFTTKIG